MVAKLGRGALMAKFDVQSAYRNVAVLPSQRYLLGKFYVDLVLPFGLRSCPWRTYVLHQMLLALSGTVHYGCPLKCQCRLPTKSYFQSLLPLISGVISGPTRVVLLCLLKN
jgi:hypothetical protein